MDVHKLPFYVYLAGETKSFIIPVYQRDYAWTRINCEKLWNDLVSLGEDGKIDHFLGTLVAIGEGYEEYVVIDGQQRLTTISLLLIALTNYLKNKKSQTEEEKKLSDRISDLLINRYSSEDKKIRLKPNKHDKECFEKLFDNRGENVESVDSNIVNNYNFFQDKIKSENISPEKIFELFKKLKMVLIHLDRGKDDPQLIFESLNSTGIGLTAGDLIRNYMLMDLEPAEQETMYKKYWIEIERLTEDVAEFSRNYLMSKTKRSVKKADVYTTFKKYSSDSFNKDKETMLKDLLYFAKIYSWFVQINKHPNNELNERLERLNKLEFNVTHPYLLDVFNDLGNNLFSQQDVKKILITIESYVFRKILTDNSTQGLNKMFVILSKEIKKEKTWREEYLEILYFTLLEKTGSQRFPDNEEFENALINKEVYKFRAKNKNFLLESLENHKSAYQEVEVGEQLTVEHIMPQALTKDWKHKLGEDWREIHKKYLHTLGNLTLTAKNSELSNSGFEDKQKIDFQTSKLKLNFKVDGLTKWNDEKIVERARDLIKDAKDIWPYPTTKYSKPKSEETVFDLTSEEDFSGTKPFRLYIEDDEISIVLKSWRDLLREVCKILCNFSPTQFSEVQNSGEFKWWFNTERPSSRPTEFIPGRFVEGNVSSTSIIGFLSKICERLNYPAENISFSIKTGSAEKSPK